MKDTYKHKGMRKKLAEALRGKGIRDEPVLRAIETVPRHYFMDAAFDKFAYEDQAFPIGEGQTISQPYTVAFQTQLLQLEKRQKVLEVGTGSGYQSCVLDETGARVFTIERNKKLYEKTKPFLERIGYGRVRCFFGDGYEGLPAYAPFDRILVTAGAPSVPPRLQEQLRTGGRLVIPVGTGEIQKMICITRVSEKEFRTEAAGSFKFVPLLKGKNWT